MDGLGSNVLLFSAGAFAAGAVLIFVLQLATGNRDRRLWIRWVVLMVTVSVIMIPAWLDSYWFGGALTLIAALTSWEMFSALNRMHWSYGRWFGVVVSVLLVVLPTVGLGRAVEPLLAITGICLLFVPIFSDTNKSDFQRAAGTLLGLLFPGWCLACLARLPEFGNTLGDVIFVYGALEVNDSFAFILGTILGRRPFMPKLSPNKTLQGTVGGLCAATIAGYFLWFALPSLSQIVCAALALGVGLIGVAADLAVSAIKRQVGVKDFAHRIPEQGGVLDTYDSLILVGPFWYWVLYIVRYYGL